MEVKIRTMRSDIESMRRSGGGTPSFRDVAVKGLSMEKEYHPAAVSETPMPSPAMPATTPAQPVRAPLPSPSVAPSAHVAPEIPAETPVPPTQEIPRNAGQGSHVVPILIVTLVAILALGAVGYFAYTLFVK
jgi:hypothetical protein